MFQHFSASRVTGQTGRPRRCHSWRRSNQEFQDDICDTAGCQLHAAYLSGQGAMAARHVRHNIKVRVDPALAVAVRKGRHEKGYAIWLLARTLDQAGRGRVDRESLAALAERAGLSHKRWTRWLQDATRAGFVSVGRRGFVRLASLERVCLQLGVDGLPGLPVETPATLDKIGRWRAQLWAAWHAGRSRQPDVPIARATMQRATGLPARTQRVYELRARVRRRQNLAIDTDHPLTPEAAEAWARAAREFRGRPGAFVIYRKLRSNQTVVAYRAYHLPNTYSSPLTPTKRGRRRSIHRTCRYRATHLVTYGGPGTCDVVKRTPRIFFDCASAARESLQAYDRRRERLPSGERVRLVERQPDPRAEVYAPRGYTRAGRRLWKPLPQTPTPEPQDHRAVATPACGRACSGREEGKSASAAPMANPSSWGGGTPFNSGRICPQKSAAS